MRREKQLCRLREELDQKPPKWEEEWSVEERCLPCSCPSFKSPLRGPPPGHSIENSLLLHLPSSPPSHLLMHSIASRDPTRQLKKKLREVKTLHLQGPEVTGSTTMQ